MSINNYANTDSKVQQIVPAVDHNDSGKLKDILIALGLVLIGCVEAIPTLRLLYSVLFTEELDWLGFGFLFDILGVLAPICAGIPAFFLSFSKHEREMRRFLLICTLWLPASAFVSLSINWLMIVREWRFFGWPGLGSQFFPLVLGPFGLWILVRKKPTFLVYIFYTMMVIPIVWYPIVWYGILITSSR